MSCGPDPIGEFIERLCGSAAAGRFVRGSLAKYRGAEPGLQRVLLRCLMLRGEPQLQLVYRHATKDITKNHALDAAPAVLAGLLGAHEFRHAHLQTDGAEVELVITQRGQARLHERAVAAPAATAAPAHNREKQRWIEPERPFLAELGVMTPQAEPVPAMARKWKQINKFVEVLAHALDASPLAGQQTLRVADFGSGKGYLTFAVHDWLRHSRALDAQVTGIELRPDLVALCNGVASKLGLEDLRFEQGDVQHRQPQPLDVMIALHACDTATDHAIDLALRGGAAVILCSPCCHKQIRPQLLQPHPLKAILQYGVHLGQEAEMLTDSLRALWLEACGYDTQVFEFVSLEHTNKNKMILAVKRRTPKPASAVLEQIAQVKSFYGVREHCLETLLRQRAALPT